MFARFRPSRESADVITLPFSALVHNMAFDYLQSHPRATGTLCKHGSGCHDVLRCTFVHLIATDRYVPTAVPECCVCVLPAACSYKCVPPCPFVCCSKCMSRHVMGGWRPLLVEKDSAALCCLGCERPIAAQEAARLLLPEAMVVYMEEQKRFHSLEVLGAAQRALEKLNCDVAPLMDMQLTLRMEGRSRMCPACHHGPVAFNGCDDLTAHHGEKRNGAVLDNSCPHCGRFLADIRQWPLWDGVVRAEADLLLPRRSASNVDENIAASDDAHYDDYEEDDVDEATYYEDEDGDYYELDDGDYYDYSEEDVDEAYARYARRDRPAPLPTKQPTSGHVPRRASGRHH